MANTVIPNTFQNPNTYVDQAMELLSGEEFKCLTFAVRHIYGWKDKIGERKNRITFTMFEHGFTTNDGHHFGGTGLARKAIGDAIEQLVKYDLLIKGDKVSGGQEYEIGEKPDWAGLQKRETDRLAKNLARTANARKNNPRYKNSVSATNQFADSHTNQDDYAQLVPLTTEQLDGLTESQLATLTDGGQSDKPAPSTSLSTSTKTHIQTHIQNKDSAPQIGAVTSPDPPSKPESSKPKSDRIDPKLIDAFIEAWLNNLPAPPASNQYQRLGVRKAAEALIRTEHTHEEMARFMTATYQDPFWDGKVIQLGYVADHMPAWLKGGSVLRPSNGSRRAEPPPSTAAPGSTHGVGLPPSAFRKKEGAT